MVQTYEGNIPQATAPVKLTLPTWAKECGYYRVSRGSGRISARISRLDPKRKPLVYQVDDIGFCNCEASTQFNKTSCRHYQMARDFFRLFRCPYHTSYSAVHRDYAVARIEIGGMTESNLVCVHCYALRRKTPIAATGWLGMALSEEDAALVLAIQRSFEKYEPQILAAYGSAALEGH